MKSGKLNQIISFYENESTEDGYGGTVPADSLYWTTHAEVKPKTSNRQNEAGQIEIKQGYEFKVRYRVDKIVKADMLVKYRADLLIVESVMPDHVFRDYVIIKCWFTHNG